MIYIMNCLFLAQGHITNDLYNELFISGSRPSFYYRKFKNLMLCFYYGLPKIQKPNAPLRPIISGVGTFCHPTAKFLAKLLLPLTKNDNILKDTFDFVNRLKSITLHYNRLLWFRLMSVLYLLMCPYKKLLILLYNGFMIKMKLLQLFHVMT